MSGTRETVLAIGDPWHDSAFAVFDARGLRHVEVERLTRRKYEPLDSLIAACLFEPETVRAAGFLVVEEGRTYAPILRSIQKGQGVDSRVEAERLVKAQRPILADIANDQERRIIIELEHLLERLNDGSLPFEIRNHHYCHAVNAFLSSGFDSALTVTLDGGGTHFLEGRQVEVHGSVYNFSREESLNDAPDHLLVDWSPGSAWTVACDLIGLTTNDAGTFMAMAAYGRRDSVLQALVAQSHFWDPPQVKRTLLCRKWASVTKRFLRCRMAQEESRFAFALALQSETERRIREHLGLWLSDQGAIDLCIAGGTFLNCIAAHKIREWYPQVRRIYVPPVPYDAGICLGLLQEHLFRTGRDPGPNAQFMPFAYPPTHSCEEVIQASRASGLGSPVASDPDAVAARLAAGDIVGLFQGGSESGRRALGNRSIVCDPRRAENREILNERIKQRQWFRPFAPMILAEEAAKWFEIEADFSSPYMSFAVRFREGKEADVPAVCHADSTARVQTVHHDLTPQTHALLASWRQLTGVPILLNTSFNEHEPIVETPAQAIATMVHTGINGIYFADCGLFLENTAVGSSPLVRSDHGDRHQSPQP